MNLRHLLATVTADVGWLIDFDELVVTTAHSPDLVTELIETACRYQAHTLSAPVLADAETLLQHLRHDGDATLDLEAHLLADVRYHTQREQLNREQVRQRLLATLDALHSHAAAWPSPNHDSPGGGALAAALTALGLEHSFDDATRYEFGGGDHQITVMARAHQPISVAVLHRDHLSWSATLHPATPVPVILAAVAAALTEPTTADPATAPVAARPLDWAPRFVRLPALAGTYPALLATPPTGAGRPADNQVWARVTADTITRIAADRAALHDPAQQASLPTIRLIEDTAEVRHPTSAASTTEVIHPDAEGYYLLTGWPWQPADPPRPMP